MHDDKVSNECTMRDLKEEKEREEEEKNIFMNILSRLKEKERVNIMSHCMKVLPRLH